MNISFSYKQAEITLPVPDHCRVHRSAAKPAIVDIYTAVIKHLLRPLGYKRSLFDLAKKRNSACVVVDALCPPDIVEYMVNPIVKTLHAAGMRHKDITIFAVAEYPAGMVNKAFSDYLSTRYKEYNVRFRKTAGEAVHHYIGDTKSGVPVYLDSDLPHVELNIIAGGVHTHPLFGFSGAALLAPFGLASVETIMSMIESARTVSKNDLQLTTTESPLFKEIESFFKLTKLDFLINILPDPGMKIIDVFSGKPPNVLHSMITKLNIEQNTSPQKADVIIASSGCIHCGSSWKYVHHGMGIAASYVKKSGALLYVTELFDIIGQRELMQLKNANDLYTYFAEHHSSQVDKRLFHYISDELLVLFISPVFENNSICKFDRNRKIYFCSSVETALDLLKNIGCSCDDLLVLPETLHILPHPVQN